MSDGLNGTHRSIVPHPTFGGHRSSDCRLRAIISPRFSVRSNLFVLFFVGSTCSMYAVLCVQMLFAGLLTWRYHSRGTLIYNSRKKAKQTMTPQKQRHCYTANYFSIINRHTKFNTYRVHIFQDPKARHRIHLLLVSGVTIAATTDG